METKHSPSPGVSSRRAVAVVALVGTLAHSALAQQPPDVVKSDAFGDTAVGSDSLINLNTSSGEVYGNTGLGFYTLKFNTTGSGNTASGEYALERTTTGAFNTASGYEALQLNTTGVGNTASGVQSLINNTSGSDNSAFGQYALYHNTTATGNTAVGWQALLDNTTSGGNTALGYKTLQSNTAGYNNTAVGLQALVANTTGAVNSAFGEGALTSNVSGGANTGLGNYALRFNASGSNNTSIGFQSLVNNNDGANNAALGYDALQANVSGSNNIAIGASAGANIVAGSSNIDIGGSGPSDESGRIRIGASGVQLATYIMGIGTQQVTGAAVYVTKNGQLGVLASSERYKTAIRSMGDETEKLQQLRPVTFHLKSDPHGEVQYGLIAEEVNKVYPELVIHDSAGVIQGVRYEELSAMLLNEVQQSRRKMAAQEATIRAQGEQLVAVTAQMRQLNQTVQAALIQIQKPDRVAMR